ncbi:MAG: HD domain-containing protein [Desulfobacteraceae bacterium]|nr:MAG: HD domain-containing protein [Desulfobacteraceae bacterium]
MINTRISIDNLIEIVSTGGCVKTGVDVYNANGVLLLDKDILVDKVRTLEVIKEAGINSVPVNASMEGGLWDQNGNEIKVDSQGMVAFDDPKTDSLDGDSDDAGDDPYEIFTSSSSTVEKKLKQIQEIKKVAEEKYQVAKTSVKKVINQIKDTGGEFDYEEVESNVGELVDFLVVSENPFSYLTQEIFSYDDYLYNHSINVCAIGTAILHRFNDHFSRKVDALLNGNETNLTNPFDRDPDGEIGSYSCYYEDDLADISLGFFLHDMGKILVPDQVLNKPARLTDAEFEEVKKHSFEYGMQILEKNHLKNSFVKNIIKYHHAPLFDGEERCYPQDRSYKQVPIYTRICKLADIYDAMTSKRSYKEAFNQINVVTELFRKYAKKDTILQYVLHSFVKSIGIYPPGSIIYLRNGQMGYVLESTGPIVLPFTDTNEQTLMSQPDPLDLGDPDTQEVHRVDNRRSVKNPRDVYDLLPPYMKSIVG